MNEVMDFEETESLNEDIFDCEYTSVDAVINEVTVFTGCKERQTENGTRTLIAYGEGIGASAFYTDSKKLKDVVLDPKRKYPFRAVIKVVRYGTMYGFKFFPPNTPITQEDRDNFEYYKRTSIRKTDDGRKFESSTRHKRFWLYGDSVRCVSLFGGCTYGSLFQVVQVYH